MSRKFSLLSLAALGVAVAAAGTAGAETPAKFKADATTCSNQICLTSFGHNYGSVAEGTSQNYGVQLTNATASAFPFAVSVTGSAQFSQVNGCGTSVPAGKSCEIIFIYTAASAPETDTATISIPTQGDSFSPASSGKLTAQTTAATGSITINSNKHNFGALNYGVPGTFGWSITNGTSAPQAISFTPGGDTTDFAYTGNCPSTLGTGSSCEVIFTYLPNSAAFQSFTYTLNTSATVYPSGSTTPSNTLTLLGYGTGTIALNKAIQHVVVIFGENISYDHYYGTYPNATGADGSPFTSVGNTPSSNNYVSHPSLLTANPNNSNSGNSNGATNPFRLSYAEAVTASQNHNYMPEQQAFDNGAMDLFPKYVGKADTSSYPGSSGVLATTGLNLGYFDGNVTTAMWNYAQHYAMSDMSFGTGFGPSTNGAINVISGQTNGVGTKTGTTNLIADGQGGYTLYGDDDPYGDTCSSKTGTVVQMTGKNIGDLLNTAGVTWGAFMGGFNLGLTNSNGTTGCLRSTTGKSQTATGSAPFGDYVQHHAWFQYYASTLNAAHTRPGSTSAIGTTDAANHEYDSQDFFTALSANNLPAVSFLKAPGFQDAHAGNSNPLDEQAFVISVVNALQQTSFWANTAVILAYDDSDGWYDHYYMAPVNGSATTLDAINGTGICGTGSTNVMPGPNSNGLPVQGRCGYGPRLPLMVVSPWSKPNYIDHTTTDQSSVTRFIEDVFLGSTRIGGGSMDSIAGTLTNMLDLAHGKGANGATYLLNGTTGNPQ